MKIFRTVDSFLGNGINTPIGKYVVAKSGNTVANIPIGTLLGFNANDELISVEGVGHNDTRAVGIVTEGSPVTIADPRYIENGKNYKESGDYQELYRQFKIMGVTNIEGTTVVGKWKKQDIGTVVYLSEGKLTVVKPTAGKKGQKIGVLGCPVRKEVICFLKDDMITY